MNFTGAKVKKSRALGVALTPKAQRIMAKRVNPSGQGASRRRRRQSEYGLQLLEKQRLRFQYNVGERYLRTLFDRASRMPGATGENLIQLLESRLDAVVLRAGFAPTIYAARQFVTHGHVQVNGANVNIPSQRLKPGDVVSIKPRSKSLAMFSDSRPSATIVPYLAIDQDGSSARLVAAPLRADVPVICQEHLIVEYYSR